MLGASLNLLIDGVKLDVTLDEKSPELYGTGMGVLFVLGLVLGWCWG